MDVRLTTLGTPSVVVNGEESRPLPGKPLSLCLLVFLALEFEALAKSGRHSEALALYTGPFLNGVSPPRGPSLDEWVELRRARLARRHRAASDAFIAEARKRGDLQAALLAAEKWATLDHLDDAAQRLKAEGRLPPSEVRRVIRDVASALGAAHRLSVIHRDVRGSADQPRPEPGRDSVEPGEDIPSQSFPPSPSKGGTPCWKSPLSPSTTNCVSP